MQVFSNNIRKLSKNMRSHTPYLLQKSFLISQDSQLTSQCRRNLTTFSPKISSLSPDTTGTRMGTHPMLSLITTRVSESTTAPSDAAKEIYDKMLKSVQGQMLQNLQRFRMSNLRIHDNFNCTLCSKVAQACARVGAMDSPHFNSQITSQCRRNLTTFSPQISTLSPDTTGMRMGTHPMLSMITTRVSYSTESTTARNGKTLDSSVDASYANEWHPEEKNSYQHIPEAAGGGFVLREASGVFKESVAFKIPMDVFAGIEAKSRSIYSEFYALNQLLKRLMKEDMLIYSHFKIKFDLGLIKEFLGEIALYAKMKKKGDTKKMDTIKKRVGLKYGTGYHDWFEEWQKILGSRRFDFTNVNRVMNREANAISYYGRKRFSYKRITDEKEHQDLVEEHEREFTNIEEGRNIRNKERLEGRKKQREAAAERKEQEGSNKGYKDGDKGNNWKKQQGNNKGYRDGDKGNKWKKQQGNNKGYRDGEKGIWKKKG